MTLRDKRSHTRATDEQLLMKFAMDHCFYDHDLMDAVYRLQTCIDEGLQDYGILHSTDQARAIDERLDHVPFVGISNKISSDV